MNDLGLENIKQTIFLSVVSRLDEFNQDLLSDFDTAEYFSPSDFYIVLTPEEYKIIKKWREEKWLK